MTLLLLALTNYQLAKFIQQVTLSWSPELSYPLTIAIPWFLVCLTPVWLTLTESGVRPEIEPFKKNWRPLLALSGVVLAGVALFVSLGITKYFHDVRYPWIFFLVTPLVEELLFRGWIYGQLEKSKSYPVIISALLFGLHHLQYFGYRPTPFALFQVSYTFILGLLFGQTRKLSGSFYLALLLHVLINWITVNF